MFFNSHQKPKVLSNTYGVLHYIMCMQIMNLKVLIRTTTEKVAVYTKILDTVVWILSYLSCRWLPWHIL